MPAKSIGRSHGLCTLQCQGGSDMPRGCMSSVHETMPLSMRKSETRCHRAVYTAKAFVGAKTTHAHTQHKGVRCVAQSEKCCFIW